MLTSVAGVLHGTVRYGEAFLDLELPKGASLLTVRAGKGEAEYLKAGKG